MISKSEQLEQLFLKWEREQESETDLSWKLTKGGKNITKSHFRRDGIINEAIFIKEKRKTLFISNEANDDEYSAKTNAKPNNVDDYRRYYETGYDDWLGTKTYDMELHSKYLGAECEKDKRYFIIDNKKVPILRMWHTSYYQGHIEPLPGYSNGIIGKLCPKCLEELEKYNISLF